MSNSSAAEPSNAEPPSTIPHSFAEDALGVLTGTFLAALGLHILEQAEAVTGGTAGLALLLSHATALPFAALFILVNVPFFLLGLWRKGLHFTLKTISSVALVSLFSLLCDQFLLLEQMNPIFGVTAGNLLVGVALLIIFRHNSSLGGFNIVAILAQERFNMRAGYVQLGLDIVVIITALTVLAWPLVVLSAGGAVVMNVVLAFNHRPGRYRA